MSVDVRAVLVGEGPTDLELAPHLRRLCVQAGADEAVCRAPDLSRWPGRVGHDVRSKVNAALVVHPDTNLVFAHRDADAADATTRRAEVDRALSKLSQPHVSVVPVQELEAWLLLDEDAIRRAVGRPRGNARLALPQQVERLARPKEVLKRAVETAQEGVAPRRRVTFAAARRALLQGLDVDGPLRQLPAFHRLWTDLQRAIEDLLAT